MRRPRSPYAPEAVVGVLVDHHDLDVLMGLRGERV